MTSELKAKEWNFSRNSQEAKIVKEMRNKFLNKVKNAEKLAGSARIKKETKEK